MRSSASARFASVWMSAAARWRWDGRAFAQMRSSRPKKRSVCCGESEVVGVVGVSESAVVLLLVSEWMCCASEPCGIARCTSASASLVFGVGCVGWHGVMPAFWKKGQYVPIAATASVCGVSGLLR